ncbi:MAG: YraN family protein, partial [Alicyclobacillus sp.]|nr:YraN family protein [Alicyclobacillus sp.]
LGERFAAEYLERSLGWTVLCRNWRCRLGEIDLICRDRDDLVAVEVRTRASEQFGTAVEAVDERKVRQLRRVVGAWAAVDELARGAPVRMDVIALTAEGCRITGLVHLRGAVDMWS